MTPDTLAAIRQRAGSPLSAMHAKVCHEDVPRLLAEVERLDCLAAEHTLRNARQRARADRAETERDIAVLLAAVQGEVLRQAVRSLTTAGRP